MDLRWKAKQNRFTEPSPSPAVKSPILQNDPNWLLYTRYTNTTAKYLLNPVFNRVFFASLYHLIFRLNWSNSLNESFCQ